MWESYGRFPNLQDEKTISKCHQPGLNRPCPAAARNQFVYLFILGGVPAPFFPFRARLSALGRKMRSSSRLEGSSWAGTVSEQSPLGLRCGLGMLVVTGSCAEDSGSETRRPWAFPCSLLAAAHCQTPRILASQERCG